MKLGGGLRLWLYQDSTPTARLNVLAQGIFCNSVKCAHLNKREFLADFNHPATNDIVEFQPTKKSWFKKLPWTIPRSLHSGSQMQREFN